MSHYDWEEIEDLNKEILALKRERASLLRKLKGVRAARIREQTKADARLHNCVETYNSLLQRIVDREAEARADRLDFVFWYLSDALISSGKLTHSEWEDFYLSAVDEYTRKHKKEGSEEYE